MIGKGKPTKNPNKHNVNVFQKISLKFGISKNLLKLSNCTQTALVLKMLSPGMKSWNAIKIPYIGT